jgi:putative ABC transport system permease protein
VLRNVLSLFWSRFFRRRHIEIDLNDEIQSHLTLDTRIRVERGESPQSARQAALRGFGNPALVAEVTRDMWGFVWLEQLLRDVRYGFRILPKAPLFTAVIVATMALGIGSTTAIFTVVRGIVLRPLPFPDPNRLVMIWEIPPDTHKPNVVELQNFAAWKKRSGSFQSMAAFSQVPMNLIGGGDNEQVTGLKVTADFFQVLGTPPLLGRVFRRGEYDRNAPRQVVLSYGAWKRRFGGRADVIGQRISIDVSHHEIIGVMPPGFGFPTVQAELYVPLAVTNLRNGRNFSVVARLRSGVTLGAAKAEIAAIAAHTATEDPLLNAGWSATVVPLLDQTVGAIRPVLLVLFAAVALVLLIACANVANLLLMRSVHRTREIGVRLALGASAGRIVRQLLVESLLLSGLGGVLGLGFAFTAVRLTVAHLPPSLSIPRLHEIAVDPPVLMFTLSITLLSGVLFGLAPAFQGMKTDLVRDLHESSRTATSGGKLRAALVISEVALAVVLLTASGLMMRSFIRLIHVDPGFHAEHVLTTSMLLLPVRKEAFHAEMVDEILQRVRALPGVVAAGSIGILPMTGGNSGTWYYPADRPEPPLNHRPVGDVSIITPGYFRALGIPMLNGRDFNDRDRPGAVPVAILNRTAARALFPNQNPIGQRVRVWWNDSPTVEIVGVVSDIRHSQLNTPPDPCLFMPNDQAPFPFSSLIVRTTGDPMKLASAIRRQIHQVDDDQGVAKIESMRQLVADSVARPRLETMLLIAFGSIALLLACVGIYGVLAYSVTQRTREIGIRVALGAARRSVFSMILRDGLRLTAIGLAIGLAGALAVTRFLRTLLFQIKPDDPSTLAAVVALLATVGLLACYLPAARAMRVDPATVLREE